MEPLDILVVAPHPDDAEISVGGTIALSLSQNLRVGVLELTTGEPTPHGTTELRREETQRSTEILGLTWRHNHTQIARTHHFFDSDFIHVKDVVQNLLLNFQQLGCKHG